MEKMIYRKGDAQIKETVGIFFLLSAGRYFIIIENNPPQCPLRVLKEERKV